MRKKDLKIQALKEVLQEIKTFGRFKNRIGNPIYSEVLELLGEHNILIQSRRESSNYWYPGENYDEAIKTGAIKYMRSSTKRNFHSLSEKIFYSDKGFFFTGLLIGFLLGGALMYLLLDKLLF